MKILAIRGRNLASLEDEFEINFAKEPLKSAGIFAITGCTGAGKSTLLDAVCLALFDATPRMSKARENNVLIADVQDKMLSQNDSRTILRRGATDGYAEVDFRALDGYDYRSRWMVRRSRGQISGSLQKVEMRLYNLTLGVETGGTKTEILVRISELIGLSFEQFSRSVLLAQGEFATFLKAKQSEKAEILEKLTGTEIYSRISSSIYEHWRKAHEEYGQLKIRINDVPLLTIEELEALTEEQKETEIVLANNLQTLTLQENYLNWWNEELRLSVLLKNAEEECLKIKKEREAAAARFHIRALWEQAQGVHESFMQERDALKYSIHYQNQLEKLKQDAQQANVDMKAKQEFRMLSEKALSDYKSYQEAIRPQLEEALSLDTRLEECKKQREEVENRVNSMKVLLGKRKDELKFAMEQKEQQVLVLKNLSNWLLKYAAYESLIPKVDLISDLVKQLHLSNQAKDENEKLLEANRKVLEAENSRLNFLQKEQERLQSLLPSEIAMLRSRLREGEAFPVCGSVHHPIVGKEYIASLQEKELDEAKEKNAQLLDLLHEAVAKHTIEMSRLVALIETYDRQLSENMKKLEGLVELLPEWKRLLKESRLDISIRSFVNQWNDKLKKQNECKEQQAMLNSKIEALHAEIITRKDELDKFVQLAVDIKKKYDLCFKERKILFEGKPVAEIQRQHLAKQKELEQNVRQAIECEQEIFSRIQLYKGVCEQLRKEQKRNEIKLLDVRNLVDKWLLAHPMITDRNMLSDLFSKDEEWQRKEKSYLDGITDREATLNSVFSERYKNLEAHNASVFHPDKSLTRDVVEQTTVELRQQNEKLNKRKLEIMMSLDSHRKGEERVAHIREELAQKEKEYMNWSKLNELFGSQTGNKFKEIAQGYTLDVLVVYANKHLDELSKRYLLQRIPDTLALQIVDRDMLGEIRTVHSLSGGESFLVSLALALGLASLSSNRMNVESLFIDEGFGSLDMDTLRVAMETLERLQTQGRKIGIISHVTEMTERIVTQIHVVKENNGKSRVEILAG